MCRRQAFACAVTGNQGSELAIVGAPVVGRHRQIEEHAVCAGEVEVEHPGQLSGVLPQDVVAKQVSMNDPARQARIVLRGLKIELREESTALVARQLRGQCVPGTLTPLEFARCQAFEDRQYPAATADTHEKVRILHAGRDAGQLTRCANTEWRKPGA